MPVRSSGHIAGRIVCLLGSFSVIACDPSSGALAGNELRAITGQTCGDLIAIDALPPDGCTMALTAEQELTVFSEFSTRVRLHAATPIRLDVAMPRELGPTTQEGVFRDEGDAPAVALLPDLGASLLSLKLGTTDGPVDVVIKREQQELSVEGPCTEACDEHVLFPYDGTGWALITPMRYHWGRRELVEALLLGVEAVRKVDATAMVGIADLSQEDGEIPGTDIHAPRHPAPAHASGFAVDVSYLRNDGKSNLIDEPMCESATREFCTGPHIVDIERTITLMLGIAAEPSLIQVIVDPMMEADLRDALAMRGTTTAFDEIAKTRLAAVLTSGPPFHADHFHVALARACFNGEDDDQDGTTDLEDPQCSSPTDDDESTDSYSSGQLP